MTVDSTAAFANLGKLLRGSAPTTYAESRQITDSGVIEQIKDLLEEEIGDLESILSLNMEDEETFTGRARQRLSQTRSQVYTFTITPDRMSYRMVDADQNFSDDDWSAIVEYAAAKGKGSRSGKKLNCKPGNMQCGGKCQNGTLNCYVGMSPEQKRKAQKASKEAWDKSWSKTVVEKPAPKQPTRGKGFGR